MRIDRRVFTPVIFIHRAVPRIAHVRSAHKMKMLLPFISLSSQPGCIQLCLAINSVFIFHHFYLPIKFDNNTDFRASTKSTIEVQYTLLKIVSFFSLPHRNMDGLRAVDLLQLLQEKIVILSGGRDLRGGPVLSFPSTPRRDRVKPEDIRRILTYLFGIPR